MLIVDLSNPEVFSGFLFYSISETQKGENMQESKKFTPKKLVLHAIFAAIAYVVMFFVRIPIMPAAPFLNYDAKDVIICIASFILGPISGLIITVVVGLIEMITVSSTGPIGLLMNVLSTCSFIIPAAIIYRSKKNMATAVCGLLTGVVSMCGIMVLWNYLITPIYQGIPREVIVPMLPTIFLPFNAIKGGINMGVTLMLYKPVITILRKTGLVETVKTVEGETKKKFSAGPILLGAFILVTCVIIVLAVNGII